MYAFNPEDLDFLGGIIAGLHRQLQHLSVYQFLPYSKLVTLIMVIITCIGTKNKKQIEYDAKKMVIRPISTGLLMILLSVGFYYWDWHFKIGILSGNTWVYMLLSIAGTLLTQVALDNISKYFRSGMLKDREHTDALLLSGEIPPWLDQHHQSFQRNMGSGNPWLR